VLICFYFLFLFLCSLTLLLVLLLLLLCSSTLFLVTFFFAPLLIKVSLGFVVLTSSYAIIAPLLIVASFVFITFVPLFLVLLFLLLCSSTLFLVMLLLFLCSWFCYFYSFAFSFDVLVLLLVGTSPSFVIFIPLFLIINLQVSWVHIPNPCEIYYFIGLYYLNMNVMHYLNTEVMWISFLCKQHKDIQHPCLNNTNRHITFLFLKCTQHQCSIQ